MRNLLHSQQAAIVPSPATPLGATERTGRSWLTATPPPSGAAVCHQKAHSLSSSNTQLVSTTSISWLPATTQRAARDVTGRSGRSTAPILSLSAAPPKQSRLLATSALGRCSTKRKTSDRISCLVITSHLLSSASARLGPRATSTSRLK